MKQLSSSDHPRASISWIQIAVIGVLAAGLGAAGTLFATHRNQQHPPIAASIPEGAAAKLAAVAALPNPQAAAPTEIDRVILTDELKRVVNVGPLSESVYEDNLRIAASVFADEQKVARIGSAVTGRVTEILVQLGDPVKAGQRLAMITSPELATAQMSYLQSLNQVQFGRRAVERAQLLVASDVIGSAELQRREMELASQQAALDANRSVLRVLGMSPEAIGRLEASKQVDPSIPIVAKRSGIIIERKLSVGQVVQPADPVFTVADLSTVWITADVPEQLARGLGVGDRAIAAVPALGDTRFEGPLTFVGSTVNPDTRTIQVRMNVRNDGAKLKPAMLASMQVREDSTKTLVLPREAVVRENNQDSVFVEVEPGVLKLVPVELGSESGGMRPVIKGIGSGQRVALSGAFHLNAARKLTVQ